MHFKWGILPKKCPKSGHFFPKLGQFFPIFEKGQGIPSPLPIPLVTRLVRSNQAANLNSVKQSFSLAIWKTRHRHLGIQIWTLSFIQYKSPLESKVSSIYFSQESQSFNSLQYVRTAHEMSHDNTLFNFTETNI